MVNAIRSQGAPDNSKPNLLDQINVTGKAINDTLQIDADKRFLSLVQSFNTDMLSKELLKPENIKQMTTFGAVKIPFYKISDNIKRYDDLIDGKPMTMIYFSVIPKFLKENGMGCEVISTEPANPDAPLRGNKGLKMPILLIAPIVNFEKNTHGLSTYILVESQVEEGVKDAISRGFGSEELWIEECGKFKQS